MCIIIISYLFVGSPGLIGVTYTRWGRTTCPSTPGTQLVYHGAMVGSKFDEAGSAEYLCLHSAPEFLATTPGLQPGHRARLYGTEYRFLDNSPALTNMLHHDAPCSVCHSPRSSKMVIPGRITCPSSWTREYYGYLMANNYMSNHRSRSPICLDRDSEPLPNSAAETITSVMYFVETTCIGISCSPYSEGAEITCVVCTK